MSVLARAQMVAFVEKFDLPPDMHPDNLEQELQAQAEKEGQGPKVVPFEKGQAGGPPMPPGGPPMPPGGPPGPPQAAAAGAGAEPAPLPKLGPEEILALPPSQAIEYILAVNAGRDQQLHETLVRAKELPEDAQREIIAELVG